MGTVAAYLDHAQTSPLRPEVRRVVASCLGEAFGSPSSLHAGGREARRAMGGARRRVADVLGAAPEEIVFTSGGTEASCLAVIGAARAACGAPRRVVASAVEHRSVLDALRLLEGEGFEAVLVPVDGGGRVDPDAYARAVAPGAALCAIIHVNHEVGTIQPVAEIAEIVHRAGAVLYVDAAMAVGRLPVGVDGLGCDLLGLSAHKIGGPRGAGVLYVRSGTAIVPILGAGDGPRALRPGEPNVPAIVGCAEALVLAERERPDEAERLAGLSARLARGLVERVEGVRLNRHVGAAAPHIVNVAVPDVEGESLLLLLDAEGVAVTTGSACATEAHEPSHVLLAMGLPRALAHGSIRYSLGHGTTEGEVDHAVEVTRASVARLRALRP